MFRNFNFSASSSVLFILIFFFFCPATAPVFSAPSSGSLEKLALFIEVFPAEKTSGDGLGTGHEDTSSDAAFVKVDAEIAADFSSRARGFMHRRNIPEGTGMIFIYPGDEKMSFWMKNTEVPLSIAFIDSKGVFREIFDMEPFSLEPVKSAGYRRYALEVPRGWFLKNNIVPGSRFSEETMGLLKRIKALE